MSFALKSCVVVKARRTFTPTHDATPRAHTDAARADGIAIYRTRPRRVDAGDDDLSFLAFFSSCNTFAAGSVPAETTNAHAATPIQILYTTIAPVRNLAWASRIVGARSK